VTRGNANNANGSETNLGNLTLTAAAQNIIKVTTVGTTWLSGRANGCG
jgi:alpha-D-ribose 1-methylphosphonate 5-triphosphate synthase subunit PhnG